MRTLELQEYRLSEPVELSTEERDSLLGLDADLTITPVRGADALYEIRPAAKVGAIQVGELSVRIQPKMKIARLLFLLSYAFDPKHWLATDFDYDQEDDLLEAIVPGIVAKVRQALSRGLLQGYRQEEDALPTVRGRIRFDEQIRARQGLFPPIEVRFDEFTEDIDENRLLKAAIDRLRRIRLRSPIMRRALAREAQVLAEVSPIEYDPRSYFPQVADAISWQFHRVAQRVRREPAFA